jgi:hypothetical protein
MPLTPRLELKRPLGDDPFLRQDFVDNFDILEAFPGHFVCTSTTRPSWDAAKTGMKIVETDTLRTLVFDGTTFVPTQDYGRAATVDTFPSQMLGKGVAATFTLGSVTLTRPASLGVLMVARVRQEANIKQAITITPWIDGTSCNFGYSNVYRFADYGASETSGNTEVMFPLLGFRTGVAAGSHSIQARAEVATLSNNGIHVIGLKAVVLFLE